MEVDTNEKTQLMLKIQNSIEVFENPIFGQIRMVMVDDEPMFCLIDVCRALEIKNATDVAKRLDEDELTRLNLGAVVQENQISLQRAAYMQLSFGATSRMPRSFASG